MPLEIPNHLVIGCGPQGSKWISERNNGINYIGLDITTPTVSGAQIVLGDTFALPFQSGAIDKVIGDFIINGLIVRNPGVHEIHEDPNILEGKDFPPLVQRWFIETLGRDCDLVRTNIKEIARLLRTSALRDMWRVLRTGGEIDILDFKYNTNWITHYAPQILDQHPSVVSLRPLPITEQDWKRSHSLEKVSAGSTKVQKIQLTKLPPFQGRFGI